MAASTPMRSAILCDRIMQIVERHGVLTRN
jgi:hypothetical protein